MSDEEILRKKLDRLNENSYYGITNIVRGHIKMEEMKMNATSTETFKDIIAIDFELQTFPNPDEQDKFIVSATNRDDIFCFVFEGPYIADTCRKAGLFTNLEKDQKIRELEEELSKWKKEAADCLGLRDEAKKEKNKLEQQLQQVKRDKKSLEGRYAGLDVLYRGLLKDFHQLQDKLDLERAANEAQHKFIREYAGKDTEVQFNYAIDDAKEVSYVIVEKNRGLVENLKKEREKLNNRLGNLVQENMKLREENKCKCVSCSAGASYEEMYRKLIDDLKEENKKLKEENFCVMSRINAFKNTNGKLQDEVLELKYQLKDIQATKEVVEQKLNTRAGILDQAKKCVCGQREQDYGTPESNFQLIADLWNGYLKKERLGRSKTVVDAVDVSMMMALMKIARIKNGGGSGDSFVDLAGYAACGGEIWHRQKVKDQN